ncbi:MAG: hypothetical protein V1685_05080 [Parcubacteria group bacterium]
MKRMIILTISFVFLFSCATIHDIETKKAEGDAVIETFNYSYEEVFDAIKFVIRHSENWIVNLSSRSTVADYNKEDKVIVINIVTMASVDMGIFFEPSDNSRTKVFFVEGAFTGAAWRGTKIKAIIEEAQYYLANGEEAYRKYTHEKEEKRKEEDSKRL